METEADRLIEFVLDRKPTISKREDEVALRFADGAEAEAYYLMLCELIEDIHAARKAKAAIDAGEKPIPWDDLKAEFMPDCSDIPEITGLGPRLERDAEGRMVIPKGSLVAGQKYRCEVRGSSSKGVTDMSIEPVDD